MSPSRTARPFPTSPSRHGPGRLRFTPSALVLALSAALAMPGSALAIDWVGTSNDWYDGNNWTGGSAPAAGATVLIDAVLPNPTLISGGNAGAQTVTVGDTAGNTGVLTISNAGTLGNVVGVIGNAADSTGMVTVTGTGSQWLNGSDLSVGESGTGTLVISGGGSVGNAFGLVGAQAGSTGLVTVDGGSWANTADLLVGAGGAGTLTIQNSGTVTSNNGSIAVQPNTAGTVSVSGMGSTWTNTGSLVVGDGGAGTLAISGSGKVSNDFGIVGMQAGATGVVTVDGSGSSWTSGGSLIVGFLGNGSLAITNGGAVSGNIVNIASGAGTTGNITVNGAGSSLSTPFSLTVGAGGTGSLAITQGGSANSEGGIVGTAVGSMGTVTVDGLNSKWLNSSDLVVGLGGTGALAITNGGAVNVGNDGFIGDQAGSSGTVMVDGAASSLTYAGNLSVGNGGTGTLVISGGGKVGNATVFIGDDAGSAGTVAVDGQGSTWTSGFILVGNNGTGSLAVTNGGAVNSNDDIYVAGTAGSTGHITVDGSGSALNIGGNLSLGTSGAGTLAITRGGSLNTVVAWVGDFAGAIGIATVDGSGSVWNNSGDLYIGRDAAAGTVTISNGGLLSVGGQVSISSQAGSTGTLNIGGAAGATPAAPGTITASSIQFGGGDGAVNFNHSDTSGNYSFDAAISGQGSSSVINQNAGWTQLTADSSTFTGLTNVNGGRLAVNGSLANSFVNVNNGGILGGNGTVGSVDVYAGGIVAPGNSIGTLNINGGVVFHADSIYQVEVNPAGNADKIAASGSATLNGGTVQVLAGAGYYAPATTYNILTAQGGVTGTFAGATSNLVFLDAALSYDPTNVYLMLTRNANSFAYIAQTPNQKAAGAAAETLGTGNAVFDALLTLSAAQARNAFDRLSGEVHASARSVILEDSRFARDASLERLRAVDSERVANDGGADAEEGKARLLPSMRDLAYWGRAMGSWGHVKGDGNAATVKRDTSGFLMGADTRFGEEGRFGVMGGYSRSAFDVADRNSSGSSENYHLGAYAGNRWGDLALRTGVTYSWHDVSTHRAVAFAGFSDSLKADYKAATTQAFAELGYRLHTGLLSEQVALEPFASLAHVNVSSDGFTERGAAAALSSSGNSSGVTFSTLGLRASTKVAIAGGADVTARGSLGWRHAFGDTVPTTTVAFAGGSPFAIAGAPIAKNAALVEAGLDFRLSNAATLGLSYGGQFGSGLKDHSARVHLNVAF